jgi:GIY-YIG catalytic domain-containing protein
MRRRHPTLTQQNNDAFGVYAIVNLLTGWLYIGSTARSFNHRWKEHLADLRDGKHHNKALQIDWNAYGSEHFEFRILEVLATDQYRGACEWRWQQTYNDIRYKTERKSAGRPKTMEKIVLEQFGPVTRFAAAEIIDDGGQIGAYVAEPEARNDEGGHTSADWDEQAFRDAVEAEVATWEPRNSGERLWVQYDPGRDSATSVEVALKG